MENFDQLTTSDRSSMAYKACVAGSAIVGAAVGAIGTGGNPIGTIVGAAGGYVWGEKVFCPWVAPALERAIKQKLMTENEFSQMMNDLSNQLPGKSRNELLSVGHLVASNIRNGTYEPRASRVV